MSLVSVVLVNFNGAKDLPYCIESLSRQDYKEIELIAIDNGSNDGSKEILLSLVGESATGRFSGNSHTLVFNKENIGFSKALNQGIRLSSGEFIMSLNPDVILEQNFISTLICEFENDEVGSASGKLLRFPPGNMDNMIDSAGHIIFRNRLCENRGEGFPGNEKFLEPEYIFGTCGAAAIYSRRMLEDVKVFDEYFDEDFFAFWEDIDLDWRANLRGWRCAYNPEAIAYHRRGGAGYRKSLLVEYHNYKNRYLMMIKNDSARYILKNLLGIILTEVLKGGALLIRCPRAVLSLFEVIRLTPKMIAKRRIIQSRRIVPAREINSWFEPFPYRKWIRRHLLSRGEMIRGGDALR